MISKREYELLVKFQDGYAPLCGLDPEDEELKDQYLIKKGAVIDDGRTYLTEWVLTGKGKDALAKFEKKPKDGEISNCLGWHYVPRADSHLDHCSGPFAGLMQLLCTNLSILPRFSP